MTKTAHFDIISDGDSRCLRRIFSFSKGFDMQNETILEGAISVKAATEAGNRDVFRIYTDEKRSPAISDTFAERREKKA